MEVILPCLYAFLACLGFCFIYNIRGLLMFSTSIGGALGWYVYLLCHSLPTDLLQYFIATIVISIYAEIMARVHKVPVTLYLIVAVLPMVPGGGMYSTMEYCLQGEMQLFAETGVHTFMIAGSIALAIVFVSSFVRLGKTVKRFRIDVFAK